MDCFNLVTIFTLLVIFSSNFGLHTLSSNDSVKILSDSKTRILDSNGSKNDLVSGRTNDTSNGLALRFLHGKNKRLWNGAAACQDGKACGQDCCRYKVKMREICREGNNCWGGSIDIVVRDFRLPQRLRKIFLDVVNWFRDMWYTFMRRNHEVVRLPDINRFKFGKNFFISMNDGWISKDIFTQFSGPITLTKRRHLYHPLDILQSFDIQLPSSLFGYELNFYLEEDGRCHTRGKVYIYISNLLIKLFLMTIKNDVCAATKFKVNMEPAWANFTARFNLRECDGFDRKVSVDVEEVIYSFISNHLFARVLVPGIKDQFTNFMEFTISRVYTEFKHRSIDLCKEVRHLFD